jgi:hypothetical protein
VHRNIEDKQNMAIDPVYEAEEERKRRRAQQYQKHLDSLDSQEKGGVEGSEKTGNMRGRKISIPPQVDAAVVNVFNQSMQHLSQKNEAE